MINFRTEGGYGFGKDVPASDFSAKYSGTYVPDFTGTLCFSVRGDNYVLKVNNKKIGELFHFQKGKYELNFCFNIQDLNYYRECHGEEPLKYSVTIFPKL